MQLNLAYRLSTQFSLTDTNILQISRKWYSHMRHCNITKDERLTKVWNTYLSLSLSLSRCSSELATTRCAIAALESFRGKLSQQLFAQISQQFFASPRNLHIPALIPQTKCLQCAHTRVCQGSDLAKKNFGNRDSTTGIQTPFRAAWSATFYSKFLPLLMHRCKHFFFILFPVTLPYPLWKILWLD